MRCRLLCITSIAATMLAACSPVDAPVVDEPSLEIPIPPAPEPYYAPKLKLYVEDFFNDRVAWLDNYLTTL